ncbi:oxygenase MpaB family protein [Actinoplanes awajinensis]|uniref:Latex clearing protein n=1 Tax=Actinoplanes awajinensis subsp. mycoplanecinus TaxID=135947 RepID=A0A101JEX7_9ACTN|nr:oxygenase MpaB family protein [Actinoplanes awajinensis]KUL25514.1 Latex clearing protein [Actinoplanes awajinensis subsp. mycoplanecinus]
MQNLSRRGVLTLGAALGLTAVADPTRAWAWSSTASIAGTDAVTDPWSVWDDATDPLVASLLTNGQIPAVNTAFDSWVNNGDALPAGLPAGLTTYLQQVNTLPSWADPVKLQQGAQFNKRMSLYLFLLYGLGSGIMSTVIPREARNVYWSAGGAEMQSRAAKTFTYGYDLSAPDAFQPTGHFVVTSNKTRLTHAAVRHLLPQSPAWRSVTDDQDFRPISNGDILITFHSLGTFVYGKLNAWGIRMSATEQAAYLHMWQVALHLLGVRDDFIPASWAAAKQQSAYALTPILAPTPEGLDLAGILLGLTAQIDLGVTRGFLNEFVRYVLSDKIGDWLKLPRDLVSRGLIEVGWPAYVAFREGLSPILPTGFSMFDKFVRALAMLFLNNGTSPSYTPITIPTGNRPGA